MAKAKYIMSRAKRNLSNRADGDPTVKAVSDTVVYMNQTAKAEAGVANHMTFMVENKSVSQNLAIALVPGGFDCKQVVNTLTKGTSGEVKDIVSRLVDCDPKPLQTAGYNVGAVLHDGTYTDSATGVNVTMTPGDPTRTIKQFLDYIKMNPTKLKSLEIYSANANALDSSLKLTFVNPFFKNAEQTIDLSTFFDLYQYNQNRIKIDFTGNELELSDVSLLTAVIPANTSMKFIMRFY